jgi:hypothetical protein
MGANTKMKKRRRNGDNGGKMGHELRQIRLRKKRRAKAILTHIKTLPKYAEARRLLCYGEYSTALSVLKEIRPYLLGHIYLDALKLCRYCRYRINGFYGRCINGIGYYRGASYYTEHAAAAIVSRNRNNVPTVKTRRKATTKAATRNATAQRQRAPRTPRAPRRRR